MHNLESEIAKALVVISEMNKTNAIIKKERKTGDLFTSNELAVKMNYYREGGEPNPNKALSLLTEMEKIGLVKMEKVVKSQKGKGRTNKLWKLV